MHRYTQSIISLSKTLLLLLVMNGYAHAETEIEHEVEDLPYGLSLFHFYQEKYFSAITDLLVAKHYKTLSSQDKNPELLLGGLYLSYGLQHKSAAILSNIINEEDDLELETKNHSEKARYKITEHITMGKQATQKKS